MCRRRYEVVRCLPCHSTGRSVVRSIHTEGEFDYKNNNCKTIFHSDHLSTASCAMIIILIGLLFYSILSRFFFLLLLLFVVSLTHGRVLFSIICSIVNVTSFVVVGIIKIRCHLNHRMHLYSESCSYSETV